MGIWKTNHVHIHICAYVCYGFGFDGCLVSTPDFLIPELLTLVAFKPKARLGSYVLNTIKILWECVLEMIFNSLSLLSVKYLFI